jgi:hypothetical protein
MKFVSYNLEHALQCVNLEIKLLINLFKGNGNKITALYFLILYKYVIIKCVSIATVLHFILSIL